MHVNCIWYNISAVITNQQSYVVEATATYWYNFFVTRKKLNHMTYMYFNN